METFLYSHLEIIVNKDKIKFGVVVTTNLHFDGIIHLWVSCQSVYSQVQLLGHVGQSADYGHSEKVSAIFPQLLERTAKLHLCLPQSDVCSCVGFIRFLYLVKFKVEAGVLRQLAGSG